MVFSGLALPRALAEPVQAQELTRSVAIGTKETREELGRRFVTDRPAMVLRDNVGSSGEIQGQIEAGAPLDLFISAAQRPMDELEGRPLVVVGSRRTFAGNVLTVITPARSRLELAKPAGLLDARVGRRVIGNPKTVPAGQYAEESLGALGLWERVPATLVFAENVRQALEYVARDEVEAGFVYTTDAAARGAQVREAFRPAEDTCRPVIYPEAVVAGSRQPALAHAFLDHPASRDGQAVRAVCGFQPPPGRRP